MTGSRVHAQTRNGRPEQSKSVPPRPRVRPNLVIKEGERYPPKRR